MWVPLPCRHEAITMILQHVKAFVGSPGPTTVHECRHCGTSVEPEAGECPQCGSGEVATYELS